ncbi:hypothetical protein PF011_g26731 [Phytophthora fragariae]|uniref:Uncharacterized protein n=1 Tax=Phytophthora fragariae TaxID=53985 RepID=A0A6A3HLN4_9STRA|nr:hypothetical protein PF011_g26731 [Phytophthora fragariae]
MFMALATPWRRTPPIAAATQAEDEFALLLVAVQLTSAMFMALATPWRRTPPIAAATQALADSLRPARGLDVGGARHGVESHSANHGGDASSTAVKGRRR